jgi:hypothetical protein
MKNKSKDKKKVYDKEFNQKERDEKRTTDEGTYKREIAVENMN